MRQSPMGSFLKWHHCSWKNLKLWTSLCLRYRAHTLELVSPTGDPSPAWQTQQPETNSTPSRPLPWQAFGFLFEMVFYYFGNLAVAQASF